MTAELAIPRQPGNFIDPLNPYERPRVPLPIIRASLTTRVWKASPYVTLGGVIGSLIGMFTPFKRGTAIGAGVGGGLGGLYAACVDHSISIELQADLTMDHPVQQAAFKKAQNIFQTFITSKLEQNPEISDNLINKRLLYYPVLAENGKVYEYENIRAHLIEYTRRKEEYERRLLDDPSLDLEPPLFSPFRGVHISLDKLTLDLPTMKKITDAVSGIFQHLRQVEIQLQVPIDQAYRDRCRPFSNPQNSPLFQEVINDINEQALAKKLIHARYDQEVKTLHAWYDYAEKVYQ